MVRRGRQKVDRAMRPVYERIMELHGPYVLVRCAKCTNRRRQAENIGVTLITTYLLLSELPWASKIGRFIDVMVEVVRPDVAVRGKGVEGWGQSEDLLLTDEEQECLVGALNRLRRPLWTDVARLLDDPAVEVAMQLGRGKCALAKRLGVVDARGVLARLAADTSEKTEFNFSASLVANIVLVINLIARVGSIANLRLERELKRLEILEKRAVLAKHGFSLDKTS